MTPPDGALQARLPSADTIAGPLDLFTTWVHESAHAVVGVLVGRSIERIDLSSDGSGATRLSSNGIPSDISQVAVGSAGYVGTVVFGALLLVLGRWARASRITLGAVGGFLVLTALLWMPSAFSFGLSVGLGILFVVLCFVLEDRWVRFVTSALGVIAMVEGLLRVASVDDTTTDAVLTSHFAGTGVGTTKTIWLIAAFAFAIGAVVLRARWASNAIPDVPSVGETSPPGASGP